MRSKYTITPVGKKILVQVYDLGGKLLDQDQFLPGTRARRVALARSLGIEDGALLAAIEEATTAGKAIERTIGGAPPAATVEYTLVRRLDETDDSPAATREPFDPVSALRTVADASVDLLVKWRDSSRLCCLDVDYHGKKPPHESWLTERVLSDLAPRPVAWHFSKGGGLHLFYKATDPFTADELASVAALCWLRIDPTAGVELKTGVRGAGDAPLEGSPDGVQDAQAAVGQWLGRPDGATDDEARDEWLDARGLEIGGRYGHSVCPIDRTPGDDKERDPVSVTEYGVYCFRCAGKGYSFGCRKPGFAPWGVLLGSPASGDVGLMVRSLTPWGHAKQVLTRKYGLPEAFAERAYRAALKVAHTGSDSAALIALAFHPDTSDIARVGDAWVSVAAGLEFDRESVGPLLECFPATVSLDDKGKPRARASTVALLKQSHDHRDRGFPRIEKIWGQRLRGPHLADVADDTVIELFPSTLDPRFRPRYVKKRERLALDTAWARVETVAPGIDRAAVELVICALGCAQETRRGMHPKLIVTGPSGSAKTTTPKLAAAFVGATTADCVYRRDPERFAQQLYEANQRGGLLMVNELIKDAERAWGTKGEMPIREPFDPFLNLTADAQTHVLYVGPRRFGRLNPLIVTEPRVPLALRNEQQIARRFRYLRLSGEKTWAATFAAHSFDGSQPETFRALPGMAEACDAIVSDVIDRRFCLEAPWDEIADSLGAKLLHESEEFEDVTPLLREFFALVAAAPAVEHPRLAARYPGYKRIARPEEGGTPSELAESWSQFADGRGSAWLRSRRLTERDWSGILKFGKLIELDVQDDGTAVYVRFRSGGTFRAPSEINEAIVPKGWTP